MKLKLPYKLPTKTAHVHQPSSKTTKQEEAVWRVDDIPEDRQRNISHVRRKAGFSKAPRDGALTMVQAVPLEKASTKEPPEDETICEQASDP